MSQCHDPAIDIARQPTTRTRNLTIPFHSDEPSTSTPTNRQPRHHPNRVHDSNECPQRSSRFPALDRSRRGQQIQSLTPSRPSSSRHHGSLRSRPSHVRTRAHTIRTGEHTDRVHTVTMDQRGSPAPLRSTSTTRTLPAPLRSQFGQNVLTLPDDNETDPLTLPSDPVPVCTRFRLRHYGHPTTGRLATRPT